MLMSEPAEFVKTFVTDLDAALGKLKPNAKLSQLQRLWLGFCLTGMLLTNTVCWAKFERVSLGEYSIAALSWMFREAKIAWDHLLLASVTVVLERHGITEGVLVLDAGRTVVRLLPPLVIEKAQIDKAIKVLDSVLGEEENERAGSTIPN